MSEQDPAAGGTPAPDAGTQGTPQGTPGAADQGSSGSPGILGKESASAAPVAPADWPSDWRARLAGDDAAYAKGLDRFADPKDLAKSYRDLERKLSTEPRAPKNPGPNATAEERQAYRKELGIPDAPDGYDTKIAEGFTWGDADKPVLEDFTKYAHTQDMPPDQVKKSLAWYAQFQEREKSAMFARDEGHRVTGIDELRKDWGADFPRNITAIENLTSTWTKNAKDSFLMARGPDGRMLANNPGVLRELVRMSLDLNPEHAHVRPGDNDPGKTIGSRINELNGMMGDRGGPYWRGPQATELQQEYRDLVETRQKMKDREAA